MKNLNIKFVLVLIAFASSVGLLQAQQIPMYTGYTVNNFLLSPSFAGTGESDVRMMVLNRLQFAGIQGAPVTMMAAADGPIKKQNMGLGTQIYTDKLGLLRQTGINLSYSYHINLGDDTRVYFGLGAQLGQLSLDFDHVRAVDMSDELLNLQSASKLLVNGSFGMHLTHKDFTIGFAAPQVFGTRIAYQNYVSNQHTDYVMQRHYMALMSYKFDVNENLNIKPIVMMRTAAGLNPQFDVNLMATIRKSAFLSVGYRSDYALTFGGGVNVSPNLMMGYSYDLSINDIAGYSYGSHEFMLAYNYYKGLDRRDMEKKIEEEREMERKRAEDLYGTKIDKLESDLDEQNEMNRMQKEEIDRLKDIIESYGAELDSIKATNAKLLAGEIKSFGNAGGYDVNGDGVVDDADDTNHDGVVDEKDFARDKTTGKVIVPERVNKQVLDNNPKPSGKYAVVIASFKKMEYAIQHQQMLKRTGDTEQTYVVQSASGEWFYVYKKAFDDPNVAQTYLNGLSREGLEPFMYPWIYVRP
ncbi:type IX secretion system membrane protein PorP/SprF [bacterium]|nr:type IX secretion system membrane protein PorP/SprF [bacterium]